MKTEDVTIEELRAAIKTVEKACQKGSGTEVIDFAVALQVLYAEVERKSETVGNR